MITVRRRYVEIEIPDEKGDDLKKEKKDFQKDFQLEKDLNLPLEILEQEKDSKILIDIALRLGKMRVQDIAYDLNIDINTLRKYRNHIFKKLTETQKIMILSQEQKIDELRKRIMGGEIKRRRPYPIGIEGLVRGIVRDLTKEGKSIRQISNQTHLDTSTITYHKEKINNGTRRKYPPRIMNMSPNKDIKIKKLLEKNKSQKDICEILDIASATASTIVNKIRKEENIG